MGYLVLARKWRPLTFDEVAGQDHVTSTLANAITAGRVAHAYLFTGPRGVGKTTTARILARALNCETGPTPTPCGRCDGCKSITSGSNLDVLEIDGASNRGIDDVRELREQVRYAPSEGRYKVYIVDEVHMLTDQAFNALLKTLEEPPAHVVFIFATTSPQKIPVTILSRCQRFDFSRIPAGIIRDRLAKIAKSEKFDIDEEALALLSRKARGSLRDAESLLDQVTSAADGPLDEKKVVDLLGVGDSDLFFAMCDHVAGGDAAAALKGMDEAFRSGLDTGEFMLGLQEHLRSLFLLSVDPGLEDALDVPASELAHFKEQASRFKQRELLRFMEITSQTTGTMKRSDDPRFHTELALARMCETGTEHGLGDILRRLEDLEARLSGGAPGDGGPGGGGEAKRAGGNAATRPGKGGPRRPGKKASADAGEERRGDREAEARSADRPQGEDAEDRVGVRPGKSAKRESSDPISVELLSPRELETMWNEVVRKVTEEKTYLGNFLAVASPVEAESGALALGFPKECNFHKERVSEGANRRLVQKAMQGVFGKFLQLRCVTMEGTSMPLGAEGSAEGAFEGGTLSDEAAPSWTGVPRNAAVSAPYMGGAPQAATAVSPRVGAPEVSGAGRSGGAVGVGAPSVETGEPENRGAGDRDEPLRRVLSVFEGEIVEGPGAGS